MDPDDVPGAGVGAIPQLQSRQVRTLRVFLECELFVAIRHTSERGTVPLWQGPSTSGYTWAGFCIWIAWIWDSTSDGKNIYNLFTQNYNGLARYFVNRCKTPFQDDTLLFPEHQNFWNFIKNPLRKLKNMKYFPENFWKSILRKKMNRDFNYKL